MQNIFSVFPEDHIFTFLEETKSSLSRILDVHSVIYFSIIKGLHEALMCNSFHSIITECFQLILSFLLVTTQVLHKCYLLLIFYTIHFCNKSIIE